MTFIRRSFPFQFCYAWCASEARQQIEQFQLIPLNDIVVDIHNKIYLFLIDRYFWWRVYKKLRSLLTCHLALNPKYSIMNVFTTRCGVTNAQMASVTTDPAATELRYALQIDMSMSVVRVEVRLHHVARFCTCHSAIRCATRSPSRPSTLWRIWKIVAHYNRSVGRDVTQIRQPAQVSCQLIDRDERVPHDRSW